jgi:hypothetical protein
MDISSALSPEMMSAEEQLSAVYAEKERLAAALGVSDADEIIEMVRSLEEQLCVLYAEMA